MNTIERKPKTNYFATGLAIGIPIGTPIALAMGSLILAPVFGLILGLVLGWAMESQHKNDTEPEYEAASGISGKTLWFFLLIGGIVLFAELLIYLNHTQVL